MKKLRIRFEEATARVESMTLLAAVLVDESLPTYLEDFFEDEDIEDLERCFGPLPDYLRDELEERDMGGVVEWLVRNDKLGYLIQFATPVMRPYKLKSGTCGASYSWGHYARRWVYGDTLDAALDQGFEWVKKQREKEVTRAKEANTYEEE